MKKNTCAFFKVVRKGFSASYFLMRNPLTALAIPLILIIRGIRPLVHIRIGNLRSERIGHFAFEPEMYLCEKDMGFQKQGTIDLFYCNVSISNSYLLKMWKKKLTIVPRFFIFLDKANQLLPGSSNHNIPLHSNKHEDIHGLLDKLPPHLEFNQKEELEGFENLRLMGISPNAKFICFISRDSKYLDNLYGKGKMEYHNYRDSNIDNYLLAANSMVKEGYYMIRMGAIVEKTLSVDNPMIIDYASKYRSEFMDLFLLANCTFFITSNSGTCAVATIFRRPNAFGNVTPFTGAHGISRAPDIFIPKKYWSKDKKRLLTINEIFETGAAYFDTSNQFSDKGIELIENTSEEIRDFAIEMCQRQNGAWKTTPEEVNLYKTYSEILNNNHCDQEKMPRIAISFLRINKNLLVEN